MASPIMVWWQPAPTAKSIFPGGSVTTQSRGSFGALAKMRSITLTNGRPDLDDWSADGYSGGRQPRAIATGAGSQINGTDIGVTVSGLLASDARADCLDFHGKELA